MSAADVVVGLEVAADSVGSALAAQDGGAIRVELCGGLDGGGLTPSFGTLAVVRERLHIPLYVLIRPRVGDFVFDAAEVEVMRRDVEQCVRLGCDGVVLGALDPQGQVDLPAMRALIEAAGTLGVTFHRAIDVSADPARVLEDAITLGCERVLTSGARASALEGRDHCRPGATGRRADQHHAGCGCLGGQCAGTARRHRCARISCLGAWPGGGTGACTASVHH